MRCDSMCCAGVENEKLVSRGASVSSPGPGTNSHSFSYDPAVKSLQFSKCGRCLLVTQKVRSTLR